MARGPDARGGGAGSSLADQLFNPGTIAQLAREHAVLPGFDHDRFLAQACDGMAGRGLLQRLDWLAECLGAQLPAEFGARADALEAAMPAPLDPTRADNDFGRFIHAVPGVLAVRDGLDHPDRALDLIYRATQRFSMEFHIRPFLNRWPDRTLDRMRSWVGDDNYHVRRLVSEGTRPRLPWGRNITLDPLVPLEFLDALHADPTRYVTRSVANHLNDLTRRNCDAVIQRLSEWRSQRRQVSGEMHWITRHALRTAVKRGDPAALALLGYPAPDGVFVELSLHTPRVGVGGSLEFSVIAGAPADTPVLVDYRIHFARPNGRDAFRVFKLGKGRPAAGTNVTWRKTHTLKADATTLRWHAGRHRLVVQVNGRDCAEAVFDVIE